MTRKNKRGKKRYDKTSHFEKVASHAWVIISRGWKVFVIVATFAGLFGFIMVFYPSISVYPASPLDPLNALSSPFEINNKGILPIYNVQYKVNFHVEAQPQKGRGKYTLALDNVDHIISKIGSGESRTILLPVQYEPGNVGETEFADVRIRVDFEPIRFVPIKWTRYFHFNTARTADGRLNWYVQPFTNKTSVLPRLD